MSKSVAFSAGVVAVTVGLLLLPHDVFGSVGPGPPISTLVTLAGFVWMKRWMAARARREVLHELLAARAEEQHEAFLNHHDYGIYGDYPPQN